MKIQVFDTNGVKAIELLIRSDHVYQNGKSDDSDYTYINNLISRYIGNDNKSKIIITSDTLPHDPNTKNGRKEYNKKIKFDDNINE